MTSMKRITTSNAPITTVRRVEQKAYFIKPTGLWYAIDDAWEKFATTAGGLSNKHHTHRYEVNLNPSRILCLNTKKKVRDFDTKYGVPDSDGDPGVFIAWANVALDYAGVEFNPYFGSLDDDGPTLYWYSSIDLESGCVWDLTGIKSLTPIETMRDNPTAGTIKWIKTPGGKTKAAATAGIGEYAISTDGRFTIYVERQMRGERGHRSYSYYFSAVDRRIQSNGRDYTNITFQRGQHLSETVGSAESAFAGVEQWARNHPL